jgi:hypothetical protein
MGIQLAAIVGFHFIRRIIRSLPTTRAKAVLPVCALNFEEALPGSWRNISTRCGLPRDGANGAAGRIFHGAD